MLNNVNTFKIRVPVLNDGRTMRSDFISQGPVSSAGNTFKTQDPMSKIGGSKQPDLYPNIPCKVLAMP